jgi:hypothetical protein
MLIRLASDLHNEFGWSDYESMIPPMPEDLNTILAVPGDIDVGVQAADEFLPEMCSRFDHVLYVLGNHEFYHNELTEVAGEIKSEMSDFPNFTLLDDETTVLRGVRFIGSTLWTNVARRNPTAMVYVAQGMMDYECIKLNGSRLRVTDTIERHEEAMEFIESVLEVPFSGPTVVLTHHLPSFRSVHPMFRSGHAQALNPGFYSDLDHVLKFYDIDYWLHGHTHQTSEYEVGGTKVRMNPRGYGEVPENRKYNPRFRIELLDT